jgi:NAD(P)-dependent dehydrogenase (short-subunit alcohol dehydrogenase family)
MIAGQVALLVGGAGDIGRAIAVALGKESARVVVADVNVTAAEAVAAEVRKLGGHSAAMHMDVTAESVVATGMRDVAERYGRLDLVVTLPAVIDKPAAVWEMPKETWDRSIAIELTGVFLACREALRIMVPRRRGKIINVSSIAGKIAYPLRASYAVAKAGVIRLTECLALEAGPHGIAVNAICPGPTATERLTQIIANRAAATGRGVPEIEAEYRDRTALGEFPCPEDIAALVVYLASPPGDRVTGQAIDVDAGYLLK